MKKQLLMLLTLTPLFITSCNVSRDLPSENPSSPTIVGIKGKFTNDTDLPVFRYRNFVSPDLHPLYVTSKPIADMTGFGNYEDLDDEARTWAFFKYRYNQALTLKKDYTYRYVYNVSLGFDAGDCPNELLTIEVDVSGTYTYNKIEENKYYINLSNPISGTESYYGGNIFLDRLYFFGQYTSKHVDPDKIIDFEELKELNKEEFDWYVRSREVVVNYSTDPEISNSVEDDLFNSSFLEYLGQFCTY